MRRRWWSWACFTTLAGTPARIEFGGHVVRSVTTAPAATIDPLATFAPLATVAFIPMRQSSPIVQP